MAYYQITKLIFQFTKITNMNYLDSFIRLVCNGFNLNVLAKRLAADPKITWSPNFKNNPIDRLAVIKPRQLACGPTLAE